MTEADSLRAALGKQEFVDLADPWLDGLSQDCYDAYRLSVTAAVAKSTGDVVAAKRLLERAIALAPEASSYRRQMGMLLSQSGDYASARQHLEKAVALSPGDADSWGLLFQVLTDMKESEAAQRVLVAGLVNCPQSPSLHLDRARLLKAAGRQVEAIAEFRESYRLRPSEASPLVELAGALFTINQTDEALAVLHEGLSKQPEHPMILATLALYAISASDETGARAWWSHVRRQPRMPPQVVNTIKQAFQQQFGRSLN
jgi:tetratricopeptide (TPR) repeat protein